MHHSWSTLLNVLPYILTTRQVKSSGAQEQRRGSAYYPKGLQPRYGSRKQRLAESESLAVIVDHGSPLVERVADGGPGG